MNSPCEISDNRWENYFKGIASTCYETTSNAVSTVFQSAISYSFIHLFDSKRLEKEREEYIHYTPMQKIVLGVKSAFIYFIPSLSLSIASAYLDEKFLGQKEIY